jgi:hypothetical protein
MRALTIVFAAVALATASGCAASRPEVVKVPEPIAFDKADYMPASEFEMAVDTNGSTFESASVKAKPATVAAPRLVSMEK